MADVTSSIPATPKLAIRVSDAELSPVPAVEPPLFGSSRCRIPNCACPCHDVTSAKVRQTTPNDGNERVRDGVHNKEQSTEVDTSNNPRSSSQEGAQMRNEWGKKLPEYLMDYYSSVYSDDIQSPTPTIRSRACKRPTASGPIIRFELPPRYLEERLGVTFQKGRLYRITGKVESEDGHQSGGWNFEVYRVRRNHLKLRIFLPNKYHKHVTPGQFYRVTVDSITEMKAIGSPKEIASLVQHGAKWSPARSQTKVSLGVPSELRVRTEVRPIETDEKLELKSSQMSWKVVAAWMDTEGYLYTREGRQRRYEIPIRQTDAAPLQAIQRFLQEQGIDGVKLEWRTDSRYTAEGVFELKVKRIRDIDRIVFNTEPFLLTSIRRGQYQRYKYRRKEAGSKIEFKQQDSPAVAHSEWMDWAIIATWIDAEGHLATRERYRTDRDYCLDISQKERAPLGILRLFLYQQGIISQVFRRPHEMYALQVRSVSDIDKIVSRTEPFIQRDDKKLQYAKYKSRRTRTPRRGPRPKPFST